MNIKLIIKIIKIICIIPLSLMIIDCIRISNHVDKPIIIIKEESYDKSKIVNTSSGPVEVGEFGTTYVGLGYTKTVYRKWQYARDMTRNGYIVKLFGFIGIYGYESQ